MLSGRGTISSCNVNVPSVYGVGEQHFWGDMLSLAFKTECDAGFFIASSWCFSSGPKHFKQFPVGDAEGLSRLLRISNTDECWFFTSLMPCLHHFLSPRKDELRSTVRNAEDVRKHTIQSLNENLVFGLCLHLISCVLHFLYICIYIDFVKKQTNKKTLNVWVSSVMATVLLLLLLPGRGDVGGECCDG